MTVRAGLTVGVCAAAASWLIPGPLALGLMALLKPAYAEGWSFLLLLAIGLFAGSWLQGMLWGLAVLAPLAAWIQSLHPGLRAGRIVIVGLAIWAIPAGFLPSILEAKAFKMGLVRPGSSECRSGIVLSSLEPERLEGGSLSLRGTVWNSGRLTLDHLTLKVSLPTPAPEGSGPGDRASIPCLPLHEGGGTGYEVPMRPETSRNFSCSLDWPPGAIPEIESEIVEWRCAGMRADAQAVRR